MTTIERPRSADLLDQVQEAGDKLRELRNQPVDKRGDGWEKDMRAATREVSTLDTEFTIAQRMEADAIQRAAWEHALANPPSPESRGPAGGHSNLQGDEDRSAGHSVIESEQYRNKAKGAHLADVEVRNLLTSGTHGEGSDLLVPVGSPRIFPGTLQRRRAFVRDLMGVQNTNLASVPYIREVSPLVNEGGASAVSEASAKPEVTAQFEQDDAPIRKIAAWIQATMEALDDAPTLQGYIDQRLAYMLMIREEQQVINGSGSAPQIKGLLQFDVQTETGELYVGVGESIGKIENVDGDPDGVVVNPLDFWAAVTDRHSEQFDGQSQSGTSPFGTPTPTIWGLTPVRTRAVASGTAIVGAFGVGTTLFERQGVTVRSTDSHASLFTSNIILILAEERVGLAVHRPDWFVNLTVSAPS